MNGDRDIRADPTAAPARASASPAGNGRRPSPARDPDCYQPVLVLAPARSNSSVVSAMVGAHPELYGFPELSLFREETVHDLITDRPNARLPSRSRTSGLERAIAELQFGAQDEAAIQRAREWLLERSAWEVACVFDQLQAEVAPLTAVEKSPENANREDYLERLARAYPRARFLHVTRHPVPTVESMHAAWGQAGLWDIPAHLSHLHLLGTWLFNHARIKRFTESLAPDRWMRVRSEDVLNRPDQTLPRICRWLGIDDGASSLDAMMHPERSPYARLGPPSALGGNDPKFLQTPVPHITTLPSSLDVPEGWTVDPWLLVAVIEFAASIGYVHKLDVGASDAAPLARAAT